MASAFPKKTPTSRVLSRERLKSITLLPSKFLKEKFHKVRKKTSTGASSLPRIGRLLQTSETGQKSSSVPPKESLFQVSPSEIVFQNFVAHEVSEMVLSVINKDKFNRLVKISMERSPYFELVCPNEAYHIMPPGVSSPVRIRFTPKKNQDYSHELICITAKERVVVPIRAIGARAILEFPDQLDFSQCPVKYSTQKTLLLRNVGNLEAHYQLNTQSPFSVVPATGTLGAGDTVQVTVGFHPLKVGDHSGTLEVCGNRGEKSIRTNLHGEAVDVDIALSTNSLKVGKTFITTSNYKIVLIENRSNITTHFQWKTFPTEENENEEKRRQCYLLQPLNEGSLENFIKEKNIEKKDYGEDNTAVLSRMVQEETKKVQEDPMLYSDDIFSIEPMVKLINQAAIDAPFTYIRTTANVGYCFKFAPEEGIIPPGGIQTIQISFNATILGRFEEEFQFSVAGSPTPAILTIKGFVTRPHLYFNVDELDFGDVSFGFPYTKTCCLTNPSPVPLTFKLYMSDDGTQPAVSSFDQICNDSDPSWRDGIHFYVKPREFTMNPSQGTILPQGHQDIEVTLCANTVMTFYRRLLVDLEGFGNEVASLTITARCVVPDLRVYPQILLYDECRLKVPYQRKFLIANNTDLPGCYGLIPQDHEEDTPVFYSSPKPCGIVQPHSIAEIPVTIEVQTLGKHCTSLLIGVFGDHKNPRRPELRSIGRLADIYPVPRLIEFGRIPALEPNSQMFTLFNEGPVPTDFRIQVACKPHCYIIEPREGVIPARGEVPVTITATLDDTGLFADTIQLFTGNSLRTAFVLVAVGIGTTIVIDKPFVPELNLGHQFSFLPCIRRFKVTNRGHHFHRLFWSVERHSPPEEEGQNVSVLSSPKAKDDFQIPKCTSPAFVLKPLLMELRPGESADMVLQGFSHRAQEVQDYVMCETVFGTASRMEKIIETTITCKFVDPSIEISAKKLSFRVEKKPSDVLALQYKPLALTNTCSLPLDLMLDLEQPFLVCDADRQPLPDGQPVTVDVGQTCHLYIAFDPTYELDFNSWKEKKLLKINMVKDHPYEERISLRGEVHFPNLQIQPSALEFGCILAGTKEVRSVQMTNCSPLPVQYHWSFHADSQVNRLRYERYPPKFEPKFKPQPPKEKRTSLDCLASQRRRFRIRNGEDPATALRASWDPAQSLGAEMLPFTCEKYYIPLGLGGFRLPTDVPCTPLEVEKAFSILPQSGVLQPGERQQVSFIFSGHLDTMASVTALCHVEGGPTYEVELTGEASRISYSLSLREISCGSQVFNEIHHSSVTLANTGKIEFNWVLNLSTAEQHLPGVFLVKPTHGSIAPGEKQVLKFSYMPEVPGPFSRTFQLKVGELDLENICLKGEAFLPMISVNLPWNIEENEKYEKLIKPQRRYSQRKKSVVRKKNQNPKIATLKTRDLKTRVPGSGIVSNIQLQMELVMNLVKKPALELQRKLQSHRSKSRFPNKKLCQNLVKVKLPEYVLDMGTVLKGNTETRTLVITNPGQIPVSFQADVSALQNTGFRMNLDDIQGLSHRHTTMFEVHFESICRPWSDVDVLLPIEVAEGPPYNIRLCAAVLELLLDLSKNTLQFSDIFVGQCQLETVQLSNWFQVLYKWFIKALEPVTKDKQGKYRTPAVGQKQQALENEPCPFEVIPSKGTLDPGRWQNLQIQFTPKKQRSYRNELKLNICGSSNHLKLHLSGQGLEARLEFSPPALKMLVDRDGLEATVVVKNPCNFPVEFYSLDFDELEEEKILRMAVGSEYQKNFLMPPRAVGGTLPPEVLDDYEAQKRLKAQQAELRAVAELKAMAEAEAEAMNKAATVYHGAVTPSPEPMVEVTGNPVSRAVMRHLGIDSSSDRCEAQQDRGIVVIIHGPPQAGKTEVAAALCHYYDAAHLSIDTVVKEAIANDQSKAGCCARELCTNAAMELKSEDEGKKPQLTAQTKNKQVSGKKTKKKKNAKGKNFPAQKKKEPANKPNKKDTKFTVSTAPAPQQLNIISSRREELNCLSYVLPEDLLVDILCERLKREDCYKGVVFDGLESLFASSLESSLLCVYKAVKNHRHIYMVNLHQDCASWKAKEEAEREKGELQQKKSLQRSTECVLQMDEDDALPEKKALVDKIILERKHTQTERELKQLAQKLEEEAKALEKEDKWKEEERRKKEEKRKKEKKDVSVGKQPAKPEKKESKSPERKETKAPEKKETKIPEKKTTIPEKKETKVLETEGTIIPKKWKYKALKMQKIIIAEKGEPKASEKRESKAPKKKASEKGETKISKYSAEMEKRFQIFALSREDITRVLAYFDRVQGVVQLPVIQNGNTSQPSAENKDQKTNKPQEKVEKKPEQKCGGQRSLQLSQLETQSEAAEGAVIDEHVGVLCLDIQVTNPKAMIREILRDGRLPTKDEMLRYLGLHPEGPPLPPAAVFSVVSYPEERLGSAEHVKPFTIAAPEGAAMEDKLAKAPDAKGGSAAGRPKTGKAASRDSSPKEKQISTQGTESPQDSCATRCKSVLKRASIPTEFLRYKVQNCPGNSENITILNNSPMDVEVQFSFENDGKADTFLLDPPRMSLKPEEKQELTIWAYPTSPGLLEDKLICCIEKNPDPVVFSFCCHGVHVKLEVSPLELSFDKLLLHRTDNRTLVLRNDTLLPVAWKFSGLDDLVEAFSLSQDNGIIDPHSEFEVTLNFKAEKIGIIEKILRLEVSDTENILGIVQAENIKISAEVCDVSLSIDMPEGPDGSLEFGTINVLDNVKKVLTLKNKGLYNIEYHFMLKGAGPTMQDLTSHFTVEPQSGVLIASQPGVNIEILFQPKREMLLKNKPILYCQVTDASSGEGGQTVATIPLRVSAKAVYSKYSIEPAPPINFGAIIRGARKTQIVVLENKGMLNFKFRIHQAPRDASASSKQGESAALATKLKSSSSQDHLTLGMFMVSPCSGSIAPWGQQKIAVDCLAGQEGTCEEQLYIDITGRDPKDNPLGIPFTLIAESCLPAFAEDVMLSFEEYPICSSTDLSCKLRSVKGTGLFVRDENKFIFTKVLVGQEAEIYFSIYNASGLPCDVVLSIKPLPGKVKSHINNIFKLYPATMSIPGSSKSVGTVTFTPPDQQNYECTFKASLVIPKSFVKIKPQTLTFTISGKGHEPQVAVVCPSARSKRGNAVLRFKRLRVGDSEMLPLVIRNNGSIPVKFMLHLEDEHGVFYLKGRASTLMKFYTEDVEEDCVGNESKPPKKPFLLLRHGQSTNFDVIFKPTLAQRLEGKIRVLVGDIYSNKTLIELVGEGHKDEFTLDGLEEDTEERNADSSLKKDIIDAVRVNHIQFGDCPVGRPYRRTFTITNHTSTKVMLFKWEADATFQFFPKAGDLYPGCVKDITVTLKSDVPAVFRRHLVKCKVTKINFQPPPRKVQDWEDQMCIVTTEDDTRKDLADSWPKKEKMVQTALEPAYTVVEESSQEAEVYLSAFVACTQFKPSTVVVQLKDTLPNQTSAATFRMHNTGNIALEYTWMEAADSEAVKKLHSMTLMRQFLSSATLRHHRKLLHHFWWQQEHPFETHPSELRQLAEQQQDSEQQQQQDSEQQQQDSEQQQQPKHQDRAEKLHCSEQKHLFLQHVSSSLEVFPDVIRDLPLFSINPYHGIIAPGQKQIFHVLFSPKYAGKFRTTMLFRTPNLKPALKKAEVIVKGRAQERKSLDKPKRSALRQTEKGQGPKKRVHWKPTLE
ncbi:hydrocephalus-inducing protein-like isoform X2 [Catharus ustulatus]|uniref:hydrocephalus-inducing protein-like isoform X2 n=1 Tax=Catharus ustulatus TaxID=91951 RepID=UPI00140D9804|nr:hydrocephalus-inducing protein-like isoform X2 [Catharus ustulatus]